MYEVQPRRVAGPPVLRIAGLLVFALLLVAGGAVAFAAGPSEGTAAQGSADPGASAAPGASTEPGATQAPNTTQAPTGGYGPGNGPGNHGRRGFGFGGGRRGFGPGQPGMPGGPSGMIGGPGEFGGRVGGLLGPDRARTIQITAIDGNNLSLSTNDGWTRTIDATGATITRDGATIAVTDLKVGDTIHFQETHNSDGTWTIDAIVVVQPRVGGTVQSVATDSITLSHIDGSTTVVHVSADTTYQVVGMTTATLADIKVGNVVEATGTLRDDGSLDATSVMAFNGSRLPRGPWGNNGGTGPNASPSPSAPATNG